MFWMVFITTGLIIAFDWLPLLKEKKKDWKAIILMASLLFIGNFLTFIFYYELVEAPSLAETFNTMFKILVPAFFKFMEF